MLTCSNVVAIIFVAKPYLLVFFQVLLVTGLNRKLGISDEWFSIGDSLIITVLGQVCNTFATTKLLQGPLGVSKSCTSTTGPNKILKL